MSYTSEMVRFTRQYQDGEISEDAWEALIDELLSSWENRPGRHRATPGFPPTVHAIVNSVEHSPISTGS